jgi:hypothetical protein
MHGHRDLRCEWDCGTSARFRCGRGGRLKPYWMSHQELTKASLRTSSETFYSDGTRQPGHRLQLL